jgi:hypothetical protein
MGRREKSGPKMIALVFEAYGALCCFALAVFLAWAAVAKLRPDLGEQEFDLAELKKPVSLEPFGDALDRASDHRRAILLAARPSGKEEQAFHERALEPLPYRQPSHDPVLSFRAEARAPRRSGDAGLGMLHCEKLAELTCKYPSKSSLWLTPREASEARRRQLHKRN